MAIIVSKKNMNQRISFPLNKKFVPLAVIKDSNIFPWDGKTASSRKDIWEIGTESFPLARIKYLL